ASPRSPITFSCARPPRSGRRRPLPTAWSTSSARRIASSRGWSRGLHPAAGFCWTTAISSSTSLPRTAAASTGWSACGATRRTSPPNSARKRLRRMSAAPRHRDAALRDFIRTRSASMRALLQTVEKVLDHDVNLLLLGESGSGKDLFAEAIHACGRRRNRPLVKIDCAGIPAELFEAELFGYEKGTFT